MARVQLLSKNTVYESSEFGIKCIEYLFKVPQIHVLHWSNLFYHFITNHIKDGKICTNFILVTIECPDSGIKVNIPLKNVIDLDTRDIRNYCFILLCDMEIPVDTIKVKTTEIEKYPSQEHSLHELSLNTHF